MPSSSFGKHASGATSGQSAVPEPSFAERARTLMHSGRIGSLSTLSRKQPGFPFGSLMPFALDVQGRPIFLVSTMAMHTQNLQADPRARLFVKQVTNVLVKRGKELHAPDRMYLNATQFFCGEPVG